MFAVENFPNFITFVNGFAVTVTGTGVFGILSEILPIVLETLHQHIYCQSHSKEL